VTDSLRVVFLGSPPFGTPVLQAIGASRHELSLVVTRPDLPRGRGRTVERGAVAELGDQLGVPVLQPKTTRDGSFAEALRKQRPDVLIVASYGEILNKEVLAVPAIAPLNIHASLLPRHRGSSPIQAAILAGDTETGVSVQRMVLALDAGDLLLERSTEIGESERAGELHDRLSSLAGAAAVDALDLLASGDAVFSPQDEALVTMTRRLQKNDGRLELADMSAEDFVRHVRAMTPWPGARTDLFKGDEKGVPFTVHAARRADISLWAGAASGDLHAVDGRLFLALSAECVELTMIQPAGKRPMPAGDFLRGARLDEGARLGGAPCRD